MSEKEEKGKGKKGFVPPKSPAEPPSKEEQTILKFAFRPQRPPKKPKEQPPEQPKSSKVPPRKKE